MSFCKVRGFRVCASCMAYLYEALPRVLMGFWEGEVVLCIWSPVFVSGLKGLMGCIDQALVYPVRGRLQLPES